MRPISASVIHIQKAAKTFAKDRNISLAKAQNILSKQKTGHSFDELKLREKEELSADLQDRKVLLSEVIAFLEGEAGKQASPHLKFRYGSPFAQLSDTDQLSVSAFTSESARQFSVFVASSGATQ